MWMAGTPLRLPVFTGCLRSLVACVHWLPVFTGFDARVVQPHKSQSRIDIRDPVLPGSTKENAGPHWYPRSSIKQETPSRIGIRIQRQSLAHAQNAEPHWYPRSCIKQETPSRTCNRIQRQGRHWFGHWIPFKPLLEPYILRLLVNSKIVIRQLRVIEIR